MAPRVSLSTHCLAVSPSTHWLRYHNNTAVVWIVLIRENVTAGVSGRIDKWTEERLEMMWCQHGCHSCKEREVSYAVRTTQLYTMTTETIDTFLVFFPYVLLRLLCCEVDH